MKNSLEFHGRFRILSGLSGIIGVVLLTMSFAMNDGPPPGATYQELVEFGQQNYAKVLWGAWLQAVGPVLQNGARVWPRFQNALVQNLRDSRLAAPSNPQWRLGCMKIRGSILAVASESGAGLSTR